MATKYTVNQQASIRKTANSNGEVVVVVKKGTELLIANTANKWAQIDNSQGKINKKSVGGCYISTNYIEQQKSSSNNNAKSSSHDSHVEMGRLSATIDISAQWISNKCGEVSPKGRYFPKGRKVTVIEYCSSNSMYKVEGKDASGTNVTGWISTIGTNVNKQSINAASKVLEKAANTTKSAKKKLASLKKVVNNSKKSNKQKQTIMNDISSVSKLKKINTEQYAEQLIIQNSQGIHGIPYQFLPSVDFRITNKVSFGRKYVERIVQKMPLVLFSPGVPDFAVSFKKQEKKNIIQALISTGLGKSNLEGQLNKILKSQGRYYIFKFDYANYYKYVNKMLRYCAIMLGIGSVQHATYGANKSLGFSKTWLEATKGKPKKKKKRKLKNFRWQDSVNNKLNGFINSQEYVAFYVDSETSISESFNNSTTTSMIQETVNGAAQYSREIQFLAGPVAGKDLSKIKDIEMYKSAKADVKKLADKYFSGSKLIKNIGEMFNTIGKGGQIVFPEIWDTSDYSKSYNLNLKLRTPDADPVSWYLNILVPLIHILAMAAPHAMGPNGFSSPFIVRVYYKGIFNIDMGMITSLEVTKGKDAAWTNNGLPTEVDVNISLKDLYSFFAISGGDDEQGKGLLKDMKFFNNTALLDYLCNTVGININKISVSRQLEAYAAFATNSFTDFFPDLWMGVNQKMSTLASDIYGKVVKPGYQ